MTNTYKSFCVCTFFLSARTGREACKNQNLFKPIIIGDMAMLAHMASRIPESYTESIVCTQIHFMLITADILFPQNWSF